MTARVSVRDLAAAALPDVGAIPHETPLEQVPVADLDETFIGTQVLILGPDARTGTGQALAGGISDLRRYHAGDVLEIGCSFHTHTVHVARPFTAVWVRGQMVVLDSGDVVLTAPAPAAFAAL